MHNWGQWSMTMAMAPELSTETLNPWVTCWWLLVIVFNHVVIRCNMLGDLVASVGPDASAAGQTSVQNSKAPSHRFCRGWPFWVDVIQCLGNSCNPVLHVRRVVQPLGHDAMTGQERKQAKKTRAWHGLGVGLQPLWVSTCFFGF